MIRVEAELQNRYTSAMHQKQIPENEHRFYLKWLRYYLDFCHKYDFSRLDPKSLPPFIEKLRSKNQNDIRQQQAIKAIRLYYSLSKPDKSNRIHIKKPSQSNNQPGRVHLIHHK